MIGTAVFVLLKYTETDLSRCVLCTLCAYAQRTSTVLTKRDKAYKLLSKRIKVHFLLAMVVYT